MAAYVVFFNQENVPADGTETQKRRLMSIRIRQNVESLKDWLRKEQLEDQIKIVSDGDPLNGSVIVDTDKYGSLKIAQASNVQNVTDYVRIGLI